MLCNVVGGPSCILGVYVVVLCCKWTKLYYRCVCCAAVL